MLSPANEFSKVPSIVALLQKIGILLYYVRLRKKVANLLNSFRRTPGTPAVGLLTMVQSKQRYFPFQNEEQSGGLP